MPGYDASILPLPRVLAAHVPNCALNNSAWPAQEHAGVQLPLRLLDDEAGERVIRTLQLSPIKFFSAYFRGAKSSIFATVSK